jgi:hypothetical protein
MNQTDLSKTLLAVNSTEWLNLCARGSIRMSKRRPIRITNSFSETEMEKVFASAPFTKLESSVDLFVLEIDDEWTKSKRKHRANPSEILSLSLADVITHRPVAQRDLEYYQNIGQKCGIHLADPIYEQAWNYWNTNEIIRASSDAADLLQRAFHFQPASDSKRADKYKWEDIARLVLRPNEPIKGKPGHFETLLSNVQRIADAVSSTRDTEQFYLACAIEWTDIRLAKDPLEKKAIRDTLLAALANAKGLPLGPPTEQTTAALELLTETFPKAFTEELTPMTIAHIVHLLTESRTKKLRPETVNGILHSVDSKSAAATSITFVLATSLGIELTNQLILATTQVKQVPMNWDLPI